MAFFLGHRAGQLIELWVLGMRPSANGIRRSAPRPQIRLKGEILRRIFLGPAFTKGLAGAGTHEVPGLFACRNRGWYLSDWATLCFDVFTIR